MINIDRTIALHHFQLFFSYMYTRLLNDQVNEGRYCKPQKVK